MVSVGTGRQQLSPKPVKGFVMPDRDDALLNRLNFEPLVYMGCSEKEIYLVISIIALPAMFIGGIFGYIFLNNIPLGMIPAFLLSVLFVFVTLQILKRVKRDKEPGYLKQKLTDALEIKFGVKTQIIRRSGPWSVGRFL